MKPTIYDFKLRGKRQMTLSEFQKARNTLVNWRIKGAATLSSYVLSKLLTKRERSKLNKATLLLHEILKKSDSSYYQLKKQYKYNNK